MLQFTRQHKWNSAKSQWDLFNMDRNVLLLILFNVWCYYQTIKEKGRARSINNKKSTHYWEPRRRK